MFHTRPVLFIRVKFMIRVCKIQPGPFFKNKLAGPGLTHIAKNINISDSLKKVKFNFNFKKFFNRIR